MAHQNQDTERNENTHKHLAISLFHIRITYTILLTGQDSWATTGSLTKLKRKYFTNHTSLQITHSPLKTGQVILHQVTYQFSQNELTVCVSLTCTFVL